MQQQQQKTRRRLDKENMDAEQLRKLRLKNNKEAARGSRRKKKLYVESMERRLKALEEDKKRMLQRLHFLEHVCRTHGVSP